MQSVETAASLFAQGYTCSQALLLAFAPRFGLDLGVAARIASPFGGGIARQGKVCGAVAGAIMVLGLQHGNATAEDRARKEAMYERVRELMARFAEAHGTTECRELTGYDMSTPAGYEAATQAAVFTKKCPAFVRTAATLTAQALGV